MPKPKNLLPTKEIRLASNPQVFYMLRQLVATGLYGKNEAEAAEQLVRQELRRMATNGELTVPEPYEFKDTECE